MKSSLRAFLPFRLHLLSGVRRKGFVRIYLPRQSFSFSARGAYGPDAYGYRSPLWSGVPHCSEYSLGVCLPAAGVCLVLARLKLLLPARGVLQFLARCG